MSVTVDAPVDGELYLYREITRLSQELEHLQKRVEALESDPSQPEECRKKQCSYHTHYLAYGPADLTHEGYHAAEVLSEKHISNCKVWERGKVCDICTNWELRIRA